MTSKRKGFTLVEIIVVLVILAILAAIMIPAMTGWIDKAQEKRLIVACRTCVVAAQTLASEAYGANGTSTPPEAGAVVKLAGVDGIASNIRLDAASIAVDTLTYSEGADSVTYFRLPSPRYVVGSGIAGTTASVWNWAQGFTYASDTSANERLTMGYGSQNPSAMSPAQVTEIFGNLVPQGDAQYIYPMAIYDKAKTDPDRTLLNIQYVTPHNPSLNNQTGPNRYQALAFIIDGKTYMSTKRTPDDKVDYRLGGSATNFQAAMNNTTFPSTQAFVDFITADNYYVQVQ